MNSVPRREKTRTGFKSSEGLAFLSKVTGSREPMPSVTVVSPKKKDENNGN